MHASHALDAPAAARIDFDAFLAVDIRVGTIVSAEVFDEARKPALRLVIDFGPVIGRKRSSAQITEHYRPEDLPGRQVAAVVNVPARQIWPMLSEVLTLGFADAHGTVVLFRPDRPVPDGSRLYSLFGPGLRRSGLSPNRPGSGDQILPMASNAVSLRQIARRDRLRVKRRRNGP